MCWTLKAEIRDQCSGSVCTCGILLLISFIVFVSILSIGSEYSSYH